MSDADEQRKNTAPTVPPPASGDAYSAETIVRDVPPQVLEAIKARHSAEQPPAKPASAPAPATPPTPPTVVVAEDDPLPAPTEKPVVFEKDDEDEIEHSAQRLVPVFAESAPAANAEPPPHPAPTSARWIALAIVVLFMVAAGLALYLGPE